MVFLDLRLEPANIRRISARFICHLVAPRLPCRGPCKPPSLQGFETCLALLIHIPPRSDLFLDGFFWNHRLDMSNKPIGCLFCLDGLMVFVDLLWSFFWCSKWHRQELQKPHCSTTELSVLLLKGSQVVKCLSVHGWGFPGPNIFFQVDTAVMRTVRRLADTQWTSSGTLDKVASFFHHRINKKSPKYLLTERPAATVCSRTMYCQTS